MKTELRFIGFFTLTTPTLLVTDPCYKLGTWCTGMLTNCKTGVWNAYVRVADEGEWGERISSLIIKAAGAKTPPTSRVRYGMRLCPKGFKMMTADIGVDSGQAGFFDIDYYQKDDSVDLSSITHDFSGWDKATDFYKACCDLTLSDEKAGTIPYGAVSSSGYGDGSYCCGYHTDENRKVDMAFISFI